MWRLAQRQDISALQKFLYCHIQSSMFPLGNLQDYGLNGPHPRSMNFWLLGDTPRGTFGITNEGMILPQCPDLSDVEIAAALDLIHGRKVIGVVGETAQVRQIIHNAGWQGRPTILNRDEPAFALDLSAFALPEIPGVKLASLGEVDRDLVTGWRRAYHVECLGTDPTQAATQAEQDIDRYLERDSHRVLLHNGQPVAMTGFNAALPDVVQIGGVYTPPDLRRRGYARTVLALHLSEAHAAGVSRAVLFAASNAAARAYIAIGFAPAGTFSLVLFNE
ncbi:GNAT family N-acetyltransferase [Ruegeria sp.]|uniref:GNAT family N-acetyltransferase n=1 Tax=Ruegeria sp. TaxID=1879320 RepID=UPI002318DE8E|nr:GNAT family N-acetyltransferase [Ruegeria sp.]MDA7965400.1 GNAT family N-acetyltransferase [Ruegeria sp.]